MNSEKIYEELLEIYDKYDEENSFYIDDISLSEAIEQFFQDLKLEKRVKQFSVDYEHTADETAYDQYVISVAWIDIDQKLGHQFFILEVY